LRGLDPVPAIAGRQASYLARQMYDMQVGTRRGTWAPLMKDVVAKLNEDDMMALAAYVTSLATMSGSGQAGRFAREAEPELMKPDRA
jgi:cytochrome c553